MPERNLTEIAHAERLPRLIEQAAAALASATTAAEILDAGYRANIVYTEAKLAARLAKAKQAHDEILTACHRAMGDALIIETQAQCRLADEYDAAQARGEAATHSPGNPQIVRQQDDLQRPATSTDLGIKRQQLFEARIIRDAEKAHPGIVRRTVEQRLAARQAPTRAEVMRATRPPRPQPSERVNFDPRPVTPAPTPTSPDPLAAHLHAGVLARPDTDDEEARYWHALSFLGVALETKADIDPREVWGDAKDLLDMLWELADFLCDAVEQGKLQVTGDPEALRKWNELKDEFEQMFKP
jgi:hypothetical protein